MPFAKELSKSIGNGAPSLGKDTSQVQRWLFLKINYCINKLLLNIHHMVEGLKIDFAGKSLRVWGKSDFPYHFFFYHICQENQRKRVLGKNASMAIFGQWLQFPYADLTVLCFHSEKKSTKSQVTLSEEMFGFLLDFHRKPWHYLQNFILGPYRVA